MRYSLLLCLLFTSSVVAENSFLKANCTIVYSLQGERAELFERQRQHLQPHLHRQNIQLFNLNDWESTGLSGRQRNLLRQKYQLERTENRALTFDKKGRIQRSVTEHIDLVDLVMHCSTRTN